MEGFPKGGIPSFQEVIRVAYKIKDWEDFSGKLREIGLNLRQLRAIVELNLYFITKYLIGKR